MSLISDYLNGIRILVDRVSETQVERLVDLLQAAFLEGRRVILMGNGGSAATASHIVNDLQKCIYLESGRPLKAMCLADNTPLVLAWANDTEYANIFAPQVECWAEPGDLVIGISGSGNSPNVLNAIEAARSRGAFTFGLTGMGGGKLAGLAEESIVIESDNMQQIEDMHMILLHLAFSSLRERVRKA